MTPDDQTLRKVEDVALDIVRRCQILLHEMGQLRQRLFALRGENQHISGLGGHISSLKTEKDAAESFLASLADGDSSWKGNAEARFRSSNIPALDQLWKILKTHCRHIISVRHHVVANPKVKLGHKDDAAIHKSRSKTGPGRAKQTADKKGKVEDGVYVNAVVDGGAEWLKVIGKTENRLLHELAEGGWDWGVEAEDSDGEADDLALFDDIEILRTAKLLVSAARTSWHKYKHPRIRFVFTRIREGQDKEIDRLIKKLRLVGDGDINVIVHFADSEWVTSDPPDIETAIANLLPQDDDITDPVLLDTSVLIALVSDISHTRVEQQVWHGDDVLAQIKAEEGGFAFLWCTAYPRIRGRKLICTKEAVRQFLKITGTIGSLAEVERSHLLLHGGRDDFQRLSIHPVPEDLLLPVQILHDEDKNLSVVPLVEDGFLPRPALDVQRWLHLTENQSTHLYGWITGLTVITGNRGLASKILRTIQISLEQENDNQDYENWPSICALSQNRALATKGPSRQKAHKLAQQGCWPAVEGDHMEQSHPLNPSMD